MFSVAKSTLREWALKGCPCVVDTPHLDERTPRRRLWPWKAMVVWQRAQSGELAGYELTNKPRADYYALKAMDAAYAGEEEGLDTSEEQIDLLIRELRVRCLRAGWSPVRRDIDKLRRQAEFYREGDRA